MDQKDWKYIAKWVQGEVAEVMNRGDKPAGGSRVHSIIVGDRQFKLLQFPWVHVADTRWGWSLSFHDIGSDNALRGNIFESGSTEDVLRWARQVALNNTEPKMIPPDNYGDW